MFILTKKNKTIDFIDFIQSTSMTHKSVMLLQLLRNIKCKDIIASLYDLCLQTFKNEYCLCDKTSNRVFNVIDSTIF